MSCSRTHNEQTLVWACGVLIGHGAFYNAEAISNVLVRDIHELHIQPTLIVV
jgi:hypothetical protein